MIKRHQITPFALRAFAGSAKPQAPDALHQLSGDPITRDRDRSAEQKAAFRMPGDPNRRVERVERADGT